MLLMALLLPLAAPVPEDLPVTYLASIEIPLGADERVSGFVFESWGVEFKAICRIPSGWRIKAGSSATPNGNFEGEASHGITWIGRDNMRELRDLALVTLRAPLQRDAIRQANGEIPATFAGHATIEGMDDSRQVSIGVDNVRLKPAARCP
ncbi:MAG: hypothetical protein J7500_17675 [Sphingomonas sp.]|uniref:hypothetical protein n=1 Tax=Sphingomonas sp. TaxID=28214 RepID=UPI001B090ADD|nr:hypothetical protein [Sphingomonas sp.]MBO9624541.1 hypothetical protein [Sphingomonas sp.]